MSREQRFLVIFNIVLIILFALAAVGYMTGGWNIGSGDYTVASADEPLVYTKYDEHLIELQRQALDQAYRDKIAQLFDVWLRDDTGQPARAQVGAQKARKAFLEVMKAIDKEEQQIQTLKALSPTR